jgi:hypothetical protein
MAEKRYDRDDLGCALLEYAEQLSESVPEGRERLMGMARSLHARGLPAQFIYAALRSSAAVLADDGEESASQEAMQRPEVRHFIEANTAESDGVIDNRKDVKSSERERLRQSIIAAVRDARRSKARHEIKKTRSVLMKIDQRHVRRALGREGEELCHEINRILRSTAAMF